MNSLTPNALKLYHELIRRYIESNSIAVRDWALKCGTAYSMLYEQISKDVYSELHSQFFKTSSSKIWKTSIDCIFELIDKYGFANFEIEEKTTTQTKDRKHNRQLYNTLEFLDLEEETSSSGGHGTQVGIMYVISHFLDTCEDTAIISAIVKGFCRLILHGHVKNDDIFEKLLLKYFNPATDPETNQLLGVFLSNLMKLKKQEYLQPALLPTISTIISAPNDSPLREIKPETVSKFIIDSTRPEFCSPGLNIHNTIALTFMQEMQNNISNRELLRILSKELTYLEISVTDDTSLRNDLKSCCEKILNCGVDPTITKNIMIFKDMLDGNKKQNAKNRTDAAGGSEEENESELDEGDGNAAISKNKNSDKQNDRNKSTNISAITATTVTTNVTVTSVTVTSNIENDDKQNQKQKEQDVATITSEITTPITKNTTIIHTPHENHNQSNNLIDREITPNQRRNLSMNDIPISVPTTYGKENRTDLRFLRKSMNMRQTSIDEGPSRLPKIRIEAKMGSGSKNKNNITTLITENKDIHKEKSTENEKQNNSINNKSLETPTSTKPGKEKVEN